MNNSIEADLIRQGVEYFNRGEFFECHEVLERVWLNSQDERKLFLQGLIQIAVGFYHFRRSNAIGAERLLSAGAAKLRSHAAGQTWMDSDALLADVDPIVRALQSGGANSDTPLPTIFLMPRITSETL